MRFEGIARKASIFLSIKILIKIESDLDEGSRGLWAPPDHRDEWSQKYSDPATPAVRSNKNDTDDYRLENWHHLKVKLNNSCAAQYITNKLLQNNVHSNPW